MNSDFQWLYNVIHKYGKLVKTTKKVHNNQNSLSLQVYALVPDQLRLRAPPTWPAHMFIHCIRRRTIPPSWIHVQTAIYHHGGGRPSAAALHQSSLVYPFCILSLWVEGIRYPRPEQHGTIFVSRLGYHQRIAYTVPAKDIYIYITLEVVGYKASGLHKFSSFVASSDSPSIWKYRTLYAENYKVRFVLILGYR